jgi:hypothetical protein
MDFLVAGNEVLPDGSRNTWNRQKSKALLRQYNPGEESGGSDSDNEYSEKSRALRLRLARTLGVTQVQINFALMAL